MKNLSNFSNLKHSCLNNLVTANKAFASAALAWQTRSLDSQLPSGELVFEARCTSRRLYRAGKSNRSYALNSLEFPPFRASSSFVTYSFPSSLVVGLRGKDRPAMGGSIRPVALVMGKAAIFREDPIFS